MHKRVETGLRSVRVAYLDLFFSQRHATDYIGTGRLVGFGIALILGLENGMVLGTIQGRVTGQSRMNAREWGDIGDIPRPTTLLPSQQLIIHAWRKVLGQSLLRVHEKGVVEGGGSSRIGRLG